jgi:hypothetical protein
MPTLLRRYTTLASAIDLLLNKRLTFLKPKTWDDVNDTRFLERFCELSEYKTLFALCFTKAGETYHHWHNFTRSNEGVCIEFNGEILTSLLANSKDDGREYFWRDVEYVLVKDLEKMEAFDGYDLPFMKRHGFKAEEEFRIICGFKEEKDTHSIPIPANAVTRIVLNPWVPKPLVEGLKTVLKSVDGWPRLKVINTTLIDNDAWKKAADRAGDFEFLLGAPENRLVKPKPKKS